MQEYPSESINSAESLFCIGSYHARRLRQVDLPLVWTLNEQCSDFFVLQNGAPADEDEAQKIFSEVPPGRSVDDKLPIGFFDSNGALAGLIDTLRNYRVDFDWWISLIVLAPALRNAGLGSALYGAFENYALKSGAKRLLLAVLDDNIRAQRFWSQHGFRKVKHHPPQRYGNRVHACIEYEKSL